MKSLSKSTASIDLADSFSIIKRELSSVRILIERQLQDTNIHTSRILGDFAAIEGKMLRAALVLLCGKACGRLTKAHIDTAAVFELIHNATLLHDDVIDDGLVRRGKATINALWGGHSAILLGDFLLSRVFMMCSSLDKESIQVIAEATADTCEGELRQLHQKKIGESEYIEIITEKTAKLFGACCYLGAFLSKAHKKELSAMKTFGLNTGIAFQISDDLLDITASEKQTGKTVSRDIYANKLTIPAVHFMKTAPPKDKTRLQQIIDGKTRFDRRIVLSLLSKNGSIEYARKLAANYANKAVASLAGVRKNQVVHSLTQIAQFSANRI